MTRQKTLCARVSDPRGRILFITGKRECDLPLMALGSVSAGGLSCGGCSNPGGEGTGEAGGGVDVEWVFPEDDAIADARALSRRGAPGGRVGRALARAQGERLLEALRLDLGWAKVPIIRNRQRALGFVESPLDRFGPEPPPSIDDYGKAGPPAADPQLF